MPPTENTDIAVERREPDSQAANLLASGWKPATPMLDDEHAQQRERERVREGQRADAEARQRGPGDEQPVAATGVEEVPEDGLHDGGGDGRRQHDRRRARVREVQLVAQERQQSGHAALGEIGHQVPAREQRERPQRSAQARCGDGGGAHVGNGILGRMPMPPPGVYVPLLTLYDDDEDIDLDATAAFGRRLAEAGVHGLVLAGSTGEFHLHTPAERRALLEAVRAALPGDARARAGRRARCSATPSRSPRTLRRAAPTP